MARKEMIKKSPRMNKMYTKRKMKEGREKKKYNHIKKKKVTRKVPN